MLAVTHVFRVDRQSISKWTTQLYREGVNERKCFTGVTRSRIIATCATVGPLAQLRTYTALFVPLRSQDSAGILLTHLLQAAPAGCCYADCSLRQHQPTACRSMYAFYLFLHRGSRTRWRRLAIAKRCWGRAFFVREARRNCCDTTPGTPTSR